MAGEDLDMELFSSDDLELNLDDVGGEVDTPEIEEEKEEQEKNTDNSPGEEVEETPETVAEDEDESKQEEQEESEDDADDDATNDTTSPSLYSSFAKLLQEKDILSSLDSDLENIKDVDSLSEAFQREVEERIKSKYTEEDLKYLEYIKTGIPPEELAQNNKLTKQLESINEETIESNAELRKQLIYQDYINQGLSENKALKLLNRTVELEQDKEEALESLDSLKEFEQKRIEKQKEQLKIEQEQRQAEYEAQQEKLKNTLYSKDEIIKGMKLNPTIKDKVYKSMTNIVSESPNGTPENALMKARREDPMEFDSKLYYLFEVTKGFSDFSSLSKKIKSSASKEVEQALRSSNFIKESGMPDYLQDNNSYSGIGDELNI